jgi:hypothetical protein
VKRSIILVAAALSAFAGCGGDAAPPPDLAAGISADWSWAGGTPDQIGFTYYVLVRQGSSTDGSCSALPAGLQITALGQPMPLDLNSYGCLESKLTVGPSLQPLSTATITVEQDDKMVAQAMTSALTPGAGATLVSPADGVVHAGDEVVVAPTPGVPSSEISSGRLYLLDGTPAAESLYTADAPTRLGDGIHTKMPAFSGRAALVFRASPFYIVNPMLACDGFAACTSIASNALGPVVLTEEM